MCAHQPSFIPRPANPRRKARTGPSEVGAVVRRTQIQRPPALPVLRGDRDEAGQCRLSGAVENPGGRIPLPRETSVYELKFGHSVMPGDEVTKSKGIDFIGGGRRRRNRPGAGTHS